MVKRFNNELEYKSELKIKNPNIELVGHYVNTSTRVLHCCKRHNVEYYAKPFSVLTGKGCPKCHAENVSKSKTKTHAEYLESLKVNNPNIIPMEEYIDAKTYILHKCLIHNYEWKSLPTNILKGCGCPKCSVEKISEKSTKSNETYLYELEEKGINIVPLEEYQGSLTSILHKCLSCNHKWKARPANILYGKRCPKCRGNLKRSHEQYVKLVKERNPNIEVLGYYVNSNTLLKHRCKVHNIVWDVIPSFILRGGGCCQCGFEKISQQAKKTTQEFIDELNYKNPDIICIDEYKTNITKLKVKCRNCEFEWDAYPSNLLKGSGCPKCNQSKGELKVGQWLKKHNIEYIPQKTFDDCRDVFALPFDFYLPDKNRCIEYDGKQHFEPIEYFGGQEQFEYTQRHDRIKNKYCEYNNIPLLRIPYYANVEEELFTFLLN